MSAPIPNHDAVFAKGTASPWTQCGVEYNSISGREGMGYNGVYEPAGSPIRGIVIATVLSIPLWALIGVGVALLLN